MNPHKHSELSVKRRGGVIADYYPLHSLMDATKELCSDNRHRILHNHWGIRTVMIPIFGATIDTENKQVNVKDLLEQDHILPDYRGKFIPTLNDFVEAIDDIPDIEKKIELSFQKYKSHQEIVNLLLSPLHITGQLKSLLITHNSWFMLKILPMIFKDLPIEVTEHPIPVSELFQNMNFPLWMDNGMDYPKSTEKLPKVIEKI